MPPSRYAIGAVTTGEADDEREAEQDVQARGDVRDRLDHVAPEADRSRLEFGLGDLRRRRAAPAIGGTAASELIDLPPPCVDVRLAPQRDGRSCSPLNRSGAAPFGRRGE